MRCKGACVSVSSMVSHPPVSGCDDREEQGLAQEVCRHQLDSLRGPGLAVDGCIAALRLQQQLCHAAGEQGCQAVDAASILAVCGKDHAGLRACARTLTLGVKVYMLNKVPVLHAAELCVCITAHAMVSASGNTLRALPPARHKCTGHPPPRHAPAG